MRAPVPDGRFSLAAVIAACDLLPSPRPPSYTFAVQELKPSSLIVPVVAVGGEASLILTKRAEQLRNHAGDWVFPGGRIDPEVDADHAAGALREAEEELGVSAAHIRVVGELDSRGPILSGHTISVFVGIVDALAELSPDPTEVSEIAVVSLRELADPERHYTSREVPVGYQRSRESLPARMQGIEMHFFTFGDEQLVWGTQGEIIWDLLSALLSDRPTIAQLRR